MPISYWPLNFDMDLTVAGSGVTSTMIIVRIIGGVMPQPNTLQVLHLLSPSRLNDSAVFLSLAFPTSLPLGLTYWKTTF